MKSKVHKIVLAAACYVATAHIARADSLFDYNVVVTGTLTDSSHIQGRTFVNNLVTVNQPDFAQSTAAGTGHTLDVAGTISPNGGGLTIERGGFYHASALPASFTLNKNGGATETLDPTVSITSLSNQMTTTAAMYLGYSPTGTASLSGNTLTFNASGTGVAVFTVAASALANQNEQLNVNVNAASSVIIRVTGSSFTFGSSEHVAVNGSTQKVIWDFVDATSITLNDSQWNGSILAANASLSAPNQNIEGGVYVKDFTQTAEVHLPGGGSLTPAFSGPVAPVASPSAVAGVLVLLAGAGVMRGIRIKNPLFA